MSSPAPDLDALIALNQEMAALIRAGIPLEVGLKQATSAWPSRFSSLAARLSERLTLGDSLVTALQKEGPAVSPAYAAVVEAGLAAGRLSEALEEIAELGMTVQDLRRRVWLATVYPCIVCTLAYLLFVGFIFLLVPLWTATREALFLPPRWFFSLLEMLHQTMPIWGMLFPVLIVSLAVVQWMLSDQSLGRSLRLWAWVPGLRSAYRHLTRAQFARMLAILIEHQIPAGRALKLASETTQDAGLRTAAEQISRDLEQGDAWSAAVSRAPTLPRYLSWMMVTGEQQGALADVLRQAADSYQRKGDRWIDWIRGTLPMVMVGGVSGLIVLIYCLGVFMPLQQFWWDMLEN